MHWRRRGYGDGRGTRLSTHTEVERAALVEALRRVAEGDRNALQDVYRRTSAKLYGVCLRIFPDGSDAEDVLQDAFINIWLKAGSFDPARASPITWLVAITRNRAIDRLRAKGKHLMAPLELAAEVPDDRPDAESCLMTHEADERILDCIAILRTDEAALIRTAFFDGATYADIAARAATPLGTVKSRVRRALMKLKACLA